MSLFFERLQGTTCRKSTQYIGGHGDSAPFSFGLPLDAQHGVLTCDGSELARKYVRRKQCTSWMIIHQRVRTKSESSTCKLSSAAFALALQIHQVGNDLLGQQQFCTLPGRNTRPATTSPAPRRKRRSGSKSWPAVDCLRSCPIVGNAVFQPYKETCLNGRPTIPNT